MEKFSRIKLDSSRKPQMASMQSWVEGYICGVNKNQLVVGNRVDDLSLKVSALMFDNRNRWAQVCPFVRDSLDYDLFWIEESDIDGTNASALERLLREQIKLFKGSDPQYDPVATRRAAPLPIAWKTFLIFFPRIKHRPKGTFVLFENLHKTLKVEFIRAGLMLGQFYAGCEVPAVHNPLWRGPLVSPYPAFAIRYMAKHDHLFIQVDTPEFAEYIKYFPKGGH